tara:strand:+ start:350 stop:754 length:405 start_codon:yes stop_codon:yes gene_type:complete
MAINDEELKQRLKEQMNAVELGDDLILDDGEDYQDEGGIRSLKNMMASETPEEEFELELGGMLEAYKEAVKNGFKGSIEDFSRYYFSKKAAPSIRMASETPEEEFEMMKKIELMQEAAERERERAARGGIVGVL